MNIHLRALTVMALLVPSAPALTCSWPYHTPQEKYQESSVVVLAYPIAIANEPGNALTSAFQGSFKQRIQWQVLVSWKGQYRPGDIFLTWASYRTSNCGDGALRQRSIRLLHLNGQEPYKEVISARPENSLPDMKYLEGLQHDGQ
jgi:hypothetical protein